MSLPFPRTRKYSEWFLIFCFIVLGIFWAGYFINQKINKPPSRFELIQGQVEQLIEQQQSRVPIATKEGARK